MIVHRLIDRILETLLPRPDAAPVPIPVRGSSPGDRPPRR